jgi:hypothetical protein
MFTGIAWKLVAALTVALLLSAGLLKCERDKVHTLETQIEDNKREAARILREEKAANELTAKNAQRDYDDALKTLSATNARYAGKLRDPGRRNSCPPAPGTAANVPATESTGSELSSQAGEFLRSEADRADQAAIYALECKKYVDARSLRERVRANLKEQ